MIAQLRTVPDRERKFVLPRGVHFPIGSQYHSRCSGELDFGQFSTSANVN